MLLRLLFTAKIDYKIKAYTFVQRYLTNSSSAKRKEEMQLVVL